MKTLSTLFVCPQCDAESTLLVSPGAPAKWGKPEDSCEAEAPELLTRECPQCGHEFSDFHADCAIERAEVNEYETRCAIAEERAELRRDGWIWE